MVAGNFVPKIFRATLNLFGLVVTCWLLFTACTYLFTLHNDAPFYYHPDEGGKADQLLRDYRNYNHPQLMLEVTQWVIEREHVPADTQAFVEAGRRASGYMSATAVVMCTLAGFVTFGWTGFFFAAVGVGLCPALLAHAHYFKEESALILGISCVLLAGAMLCRWGKANAVAYVLCSLLIGAACGVAASGKYAGAILILPSLALIIAIALRRPAWRMVFAILLFAGAGAGTWAGINHLAIENWEAFRRGFDNELEHSVTSHREVAMNQPNDFFIHAVWDDAMPHVKVLLFASPFALLLLRRRPIGFGFWLMLAGAVYLLALSHSVLPFFRYALPVTVMAYLLAAMTAAFLSTLFADELRTRFTSKWSPTLAALPAVVVLVFLAILQGQRCYDYTIQFADDSRDALRAWADANLPAGSRIAVDEYTQLARRPDIQSGDEQLSTKPYRVITRFFLPELGDVETLCRRGFTHVAIASSAYERYLIPQSIGATGLEATFDHYARTYRTLMNDCPVVWQRVANHPMRTFTNPDIVVVKIR